jgi:RNA polymerase subunit RPABC4/transcription elongation factor Spt4
MRSLGIFFLALISLPGLFAFASWNKYQMIRYGDFPGPLDFLWYSLIFVLFVIGIICFVAGSSRQVEIVQSPAPPPKEVTTEDTKVCPSCAEDVKRKAKICRYCRHSFSGPATIPKNNNYFYQFEGGTEQGPVGSEELKNMFKKGILRSDDHVHVPELGWHKVSEVDLS